MYLEYPVLYLKVVSAKSLSSPIEVVYRVTFNLAYVIVYFFNFNELVDVILDEVI